MPIEMTVSSLTVDPLSNLPVVILKDSEGRRAVPIWIGATEASAIATELEGIKLDRPATHDLLRTLLRLAGLRVERIDVHDVQNHMFYACIVVVRPDGERTAIDARASDAIAVALRTGARIHVAQKVIDAVGGGPVVHEDTRELLESLGETAFGKWKM